ncbi:MAG: glycine betaine ABC transporter substrate-binding protein [Bacteroidales bacterium]|nr:glycine betaine ABC transporter substrate-binding protein [Bacteroidales bacterium]
MNLKSILAIFMGVALIAMTACNGGGGQKAEEGDKEAKKGDKKESLEILYPNWAEGVAFTHLAKVALEDNGYDVKITPIEPGPIYASLAKGDADLFLDAWLPHTHEDYWEKFGDKLVKVGESFSGGTTGLVVPQYVDINSIEELNEHVDKFGGEIIGIGSGAGIHRNTEKAIEKYGLDYKQVTSSGPAMMASLQKAYNKKEPIVVTGWKPHFMWANYDLKYLEDPKGIYPKDVCAIVSRQGFKKDFPTLEKFFSNFNLQETELYDLMGAIKEGDDEEAAAKEWYKSHKVMVDSWWPEEK